MECLSLERQLDNCVAWLENQRKNDVDLGVKASLNYIKRYRELTEVQPGQERPLWHLPLGTCSVVVPKLHKVVQVCYKTRAQIAADKALNKLFSIERNEDERKTHCRFHRNARKQLLWELQLAMKPHGNNVTMWDYMIQGKRQPEEVNRDGVPNERELYTLLRFWDRTAQALRIISARQPGGFMVIPCYIGTTPRLLNPLEVSAELMPDQFPLPSSVGIHWLSANLPDIEIGRTKIGPIGFLGDDYRNLKKITVGDNDEEVREVEKVDQWDHHAVKIEITASQNIRCQRLLTDRSSEFIPAIGIIPPIISS